MEFEGLLIFIDLLLHRATAYRHLVYNRLPLDSAGPIGLSTTLTFISVIFEMTAMNLYYKNVLNLGVESSGGYMGLFAFVFTLKLIRILSILVISVIAVGITVHKERADMTSLVLALSVSSLGWSFVGIFVIWKYDLFFLVFIALFVFTSNCAAINVVNDSPATSFVAAALGWAAYIKYAFLTD